LPHVLWAGYSKGNDPIVHADLLEKLLESANPNAAYRKVKSNGGSAGVDGMQTTEMLGYQLTSGLILARGIGEFPKALSYIEPLRTNIS